MLQAVQRAILGRPGDSRLVVLSDFDGTLAEFHPDPAAPMLTWERHALLEAVAFRPDVSVGLVSGRRLRDLLSRTALPPHVYCAGLHGMEIEVDDRQWHHPDLEPSRRHVRELAGRLREVMARVPGAIVEDKDVAVAVHTRSVDPDKRDEVATLAEACAAVWLLSGQLKRLEGNCVVEYLPNIACHKGDATLWIARDVQARFARPSWVVFLGDDVTDEDAFRSINEELDGIGVLVGSRTTSATHRLPDIQDVDLLLRWLADGRLTPA
jgi:trehalose 6-phosphate phosphatase